MDALCGPDLRGKFTRCILFTSFRGGTSARQKSKCARFRFHALAPACMCSFSLCCALNKDHRPRVNFTHLRGSCNNGNTCYIQLPSSLHCFVTVLDLSVWHLLPLTRNIENLEQQKQRYRPLVGSVNLDGNITNCSGAVLNTISSHLLCSTHNDTFVLCKKKRKKKTEKWTTTIFGSALLAVR